MSKFYASSFVGKKCLFLLLCLASIFIAKAQTDITIGTGTTGNTGTTFPAPIQDYYEGSRAQYLYLASELTGAGMSPGNINAIKFNITNLNTFSGNIQQYTIRIGTTATGSLTATTWETVATTVYGPVDYVPTLGINTFTFSSPFFWNGTGNIVIEICNGLPANVSDGLIHYSQNPTVPWTTGLSFNGSHTRTQDSGGNLCGTTTTTNTGTQTTRPNIIFNWTPAAACSGTPSAGTANASASSVCLGENFTLSLSGVTIASGLTYQWQSSTDNVSFTNISGATTSSITTSQSATKYYRAIVTCTNGGATATSTSVLISSPSLVSGTFVINNQPTNIPAGTFKNFNEAYNYLKCGINGAVVFNVLAGSGPYNEQLIMDEVPGASATNTITFNGNGNKITYTSTNTNERAVIKLNGADYVTFNNLIIEAGGTSTTQYGFGIQLINDADNNKINECTINVTAASSSTNYAGIVVSSSNTGAVTTGDTKSDNNIFSNNTITGGYYGITLVGSSTVSVQNNQVINNTVSEFYSYGIYLSGNFSTLVEDNNITRPTRSLVTTTYGIYITSLNTKLNITRNRIYNLFGGATTSTSTMYGIYITSTDALSGLENLITNNAIYNTNTNGDVYGFYNSSSDNVWYYHNTIVLDGAGTTSTSSDFTRGFYQTGVAAGIEFKNNIVFISRGGLSTKHAIYFATATSTIISNYNDFFITSSAGANYIGFLTANRTTLADWQTASGQDANSLNSNPLFFDPASGNYTPTNASIDNQGTPLGILVDINNAPRSTTTPDIGAWEFAPGACITPPVPGTAMASPSPVCSGSNVSLSVTGNTVGTGQTYRWQVSSTATGTFTSIGNVLTNADTSVIVTATQYYRLAVTCGTATRYSTPVQVVITPSLSAGTYTISNTPTTFPAGNNFENFAAVKNALQCGITGPVVFNVVANSGPYNEQFILDSIRGASSVNTITFNGNGNTIRFSSSNTDERAVIKLKRSDFITFDSLIIDASGTGTYGYGVHLLMDADSNTFRNCSIITSASSTSTNFAGIVVSATDISATSSSALCDGNVFDGNTITGGYYGMTLMGSTAAPLQGNKITNNKILNFYIYGLYLGAGNNTLVQNNDISRPGRTTTTTFYGIYTTGINTSLLIDKNRIHNPFDGNLTSTSTFYGIYFTGVDAAAGMENKVTNNAIYNVNGEGDEYGIYSSSSDYALYFHNTISLDNTASTHTSIYWSRGIQQTTQADGIQFKNNIISVTRSGAGDRHAIYLSTATTEFQSDYNDLYVTGPATTTFVGYSGGDRLTLQDWQTATSQDAHSYSINPLFADPATGNLMPRNPVIDNKGTPLGITTDITGATRSTTTPDMGAWEFVIPACTTPPAGGTATATPNSNICTEVEIKLGLTGANTMVSGQTYQWQYATTTGGPWTNLGGVHSFPDTTILSTTTLFYRVVVTCSGQSANSAPVQVSLNPQFPGGVYTIDPAATTAALYPNGKAFKSFSSAVSVMDCGIMDDVTFNVVPGTYNEQIRIRRIPGASDTSRVTFQSANGNPTSVVLTYAADTSIANYTLKLDSASYITFRNMTIDATNTTSGRAIELANTASYDSLSNLIIHVPASTSTSNVIAGIYASGLRGTNHVIRANTITGGSSGIYFSGTATANNKIDSNTINSSYYYGIYISSSKRSTFSNNIVNKSTPANSTTYGMYLTNNDTAYQIVGNRINLTGLATGTHYGMYLTGNNSVLNEMGRVANNKIIATDNGATIYGLYQSGSTANFTINNVISVSTTGAVSYGLYSTGGGDIKYYNNAVNNVSASTGTSNYAAYFNHTSGGGAEVFNNIFAHQAGGKAMYVAEDGLVSSDYNMFYTTGAILIQRGSPAGTFATLANWRTASGADMSSIVYKPAFTSDTDLMPNIGDSTVWAIHGRGVQLTGNNYDFNGNTRPVTLTTGVPDLGAYEFFPTVPPMPLIGTPLIPASGTTQIFMFGTDTVSKITWAPGTTLPSAISVRRYSGVLPTGTLSTQKAMYFYTKFDVTGTNTPKYDLQQFYIDSWLGFVPSESVIRLGRTTSASANTWIVDPASRVDSFANMISRDTLNFIDRFTGLTDATIAPPPPPIYVQQVDSSNLGRRFWVAYAHSWDFFSGSNDQNMVLYLGAGNQPARVTVRINGTNWVKTYLIPANTAITSDIIPKSGTYDARLLIEGMTPRGILIESDVNISAYAHIYASTNSGATMLLPVGVYGYEYYTLNSRQHYSTEDAHSIFFVVADRDNTKVEITPSNPTSTGHAAGVPFTVTLNAGEVYQILGAYISGSEGYDLSGSLIKSVPNSAGKCYPIGVFAGSSRTYITCGTANTASGGDLLFQQVFPSQAWGTKYLTAPTSTDASPSVFMTNKYRVMVKDPATVVLRNGTPLTGIIANRYYQYESNTADYIEANAPIMVAQYMASSGGGCANTSGNGDPEMFYLSPIEQAIKSSPFYRNDKYNIEENYLTLIIPTNGLSSLLIDNSAIFDHTYPHPNRAGYTVVVKKFAIGSGQSFVKSDSAFTGIVYGLGSVESYGYNVGTLVKNLNAIPSISNTLTNTGAASDYTCRKTPFRFTLLLPLKPTNLTWQFSQVSGLSPSADVVQNNPAALDSTIINGRMYYRFSVPQDYMFNNSGMFNVPIIISHPTIEGCSNSFERLLTINVLAAPVTDFTTTFSGCVGDAVQFKGSSISAMSGVGATSYSWNFGDNTTGSGQNTSHLYATSGTYNVQLKAVTTDGCLGDTTKPVVVNPRGAVSVVKDSIAACPGTPVTFQVQNPVTGAVYNWYTAATGGTPVHTGVTFTPTITGNSVFYVESAVAGCTSTNRTRVVATVLPALAVPVIQIESITPNSITFRWATVTGATGYQVSTDGGSTWMNPSSGTGPAATTHTISGLQPLASVTLLVRALGGCQETRSLPVTGRTPTDQVYIPNSFSPNGDGVNDILRVYGYIIKSMDFKVFNQWGERIFESNTQATGWDGKHKGKDQPSGVYIYVVRLTLNDGTTMDKKGTINLVR